MNAVVDSIVLKSIKAVKSSFEINSDYAGPNTIHVHPDFELKIEQNAENANQYRLTMRVTVGMENNPEYPFWIDIYIQAVFELKDIVKDKHQDILRKNCATIMFPFARAYISTIMSCSGISPYLLPVMDMNKLFNFQQAQPHSETSKE